MNSPHAIQHWIETHFSRDDVRANLWAAVHHWAEDPRTLAVTSRSCAAALARAGDTNGAKQWLGKAAAEAGRAGLKQSQHEARGKLKQFEGLAAWASAAAAAA